MTLSPQEPLQLWASPVADFAHFDDQGNELVVTALQSELPQFTYLQGVSGSGKSHLLSAIELASENVMRLHADQLSVMPVEHVLPAGLRLLLLDDVDALMGQRQDETLAFNLYNHCRAHHINLLFAGKTSPRDDAWVLPDLRSRLNSGQLLQLKALTGQAAISLFFQHLNRQGVVYGQEVNQFIGNHWPSDFPTLYKGMQSIITLTLKEKRKLTIPLLKKINL